MLGKRGVVKDVMAIICITSGWNVLAFKNRPVMTLYPLAVREVFEDRTLKLVSVWGEGGHKWQGGV